MKNEKLIPAIILILFICVPFAAFADDSQEEPPLPVIIRLSPDEAVELMLRNNLHLQSARIGQSIRQRRSNMSWNQLVPTTAVTGTVLRDNFENVQPGMTIPIPGLPPIVIPPTTIPQWHATGAFSATMDFSVALLQNMRTLRREFEAGQISYERVRLQMEQAVRKMYNNILLLKANEALLAESFANTQRLADIAEANFRAGLAPRLTWLQAQVAVENMRPMKSDLESNLNTLKGNFALLLGLPFDTVFELEPVSHESTFIQYDVAELISWAAAGKPDIQELRANILTLQSQRQTLNLQHFTPFLRLGWTLSSMFDPLLNPWEDDLFNSNNWNNGGNFSITLGMNFNGLLPFTRESQQRRDLQANIEIQNIMLAQMIRQTELEIFTKINSLERIRTTAEAQQAAVNLAAESHRLTEAAYRAGLQDFQSVRSSALALEQARLQLLTQQFNFLNDLIDLEYAIGVPFGTLSNIGRE